MTVTETRPADQPAAVAAEPAGPYGLLTTSDHKRVGRMYIASSLAFLVAVLVARLLVLAERTDLNSANDILEDAFAQTATFELVGFTFLVLIPLWIGIAHVVVPLQVGARSIAFPRAAVAAFWTWLVSSGVLVGSYLMNGGPFGGDSDGVDLFLVSLIAVVSALLLSTVCVVTTALALRTHGMRLSRVPFFTWSMVVSGSLWLLSLPVLIAVLVVAYVDHSAGGRTFIGGNFVMFDSLDWVLRQPQVYAVGIPALGLLADVIPVAANSRPSFPGVVRAAIGLAGILAFGAFSVMPFFGDELVADDVFITFALLGGVPALAVLLVAGETFSRGSVKVISPLIFAVLSALLLVVGGIAGEATVIDPLGLNEGQWFIGHNYLVTGAALIGALGALQYWAPKILGRTLLEAAGKVVPLLLAAGVALMAGAQLGSAFLDIPEASDFSGKEETTIQTVRFGLGDVTDDQDGAETLNGIALAGTAITALGVLAFLASAAAAARASRPEANPWGGHTLEWSTASPPSATNFDDELQRVTSDAPLYVPAEGDA